METKKEYIEVATLRKTFEETSGDMFDDFNGDYYVESGFSRKALEELITTMPKADAVEVVRGLWIEVNPRKDVEGWTEYDYQCSICEEISWEATNYCSNCGAKMDLEVEE